MLLLFLWGAWGSTHTEQIQEGQWQNPTFELHKLEHQKPVQVEVVRRTEGVCLAGEATGTGGGGGGRNKAPVFEFYFLTPSKLNNPTFADHLLPPSWSKINYY